MKKKYIKPGFNEELTDLTEMLLALSLSGNKEADPESTVLTKGAGNVDIWGDEDLDD